MRHARLGGAVLFELRPDTRDLEGLAFGCLPGCGWCCTFPAEVSPPEERALRELKPNVRIGHDGDRSFLRLQGGCGACQFLDDSRSCQVYEARPNHCRWFPFHVYFGRRVEVVVNRSCPGLTAAPGASLAEMARGTLADAPADLVARHVEESAATHEAFRANCEDAGVWGDVDAVVEDVLAEGPAIFTRDALEARSGASVRDLADGAAEAFDAADPTSRPYYVDPAFRWLVFQRRAQRIGVADLAPSGRMEMTRVLPLEPWQDPSPELAQELFPHFAALLRRECFAGSAFDVVDEHDYHVTVEEAATEQALGIAADLVLRARLVAGLRPQPDAATWAREARRFYDADFLDRPVIGAWL